MTVVEVSGGLSIGIPVEFHTGPTNTIFVSDGSLFDGGGAAVIWASLDLILAAQGWF